MLQAATRGVIACLAVNVVKADRHKVRDMITRLSAEALSCLQ